jgi:putative transposase
VTDPAASRASGLVKRHFRAVRPDELWVADFTYVPLACGFGCTAFVTDAFAGLIPGWECSLSRRTAFAESAIRQAAGFRARQGRPLVGGTIHHSSAVSKDTAVHFTETLQLAGLQPWLTIPGRAADHPR